MSVRMLYILAVCPVLLVSAVLTLTIDSQLGTSVEDCFERISIGEQLPTDAIYRNISELTTKECEQICKQDKQCQSYDYGVGAKGNATCNLGNLNEKEIKDKSILRRHPDYDVYVRRFQCEQSPPTPIQAEFDDPDGLLHRPTFKPVKDSKKPLSDELPDDLGSYSNSKPAYNSERPDEYDNSKPDINDPPSYGDHKPQNIPYPPEKPHSNLSNKRPDPYDVLQLQDPYGRPRPQGNWRPEEMYGHRPIGPDSYRPEVPEYQYIVRPNRKPHKRPLSRPDFDGGYGNKPDYSNKPDPIGQGDLTDTDLPYHHTKPNNNLSSKPYEKPSYNYNSQYASNYGSQDNSIYLEIIDPPRPYKPPSRPSRPSYGLDHGDYDYGHLGYGYDSYSSQNSYLHSQSSQSQYFGSGTLNQGSYHRPNHESIYRPTRPHESQDSVYGQQSTPKPFEPNKRPHGNGYGLSVTEGYGSSSQGGYGSDSYFSSGQSYGGSASYESSSQSYGNSQAPNKKPHNSNQGYESSSQSSYGGTNQLSNNKPYGSNPEYGSSSQSAYGGVQTSHKPNYSSNKPYGGSLENGVSAQSHHGAYGSGTKPYDSDQGYGGSDESRPSYSSGSQHSDNKPYQSSSGYGSGSHSSYGENSQSTNNKPYGGGGAGSQGYGDSSQSEFNSNHGSYGSSEKPYATNDHKKPYGGSGFSSNKPYEDGYGNSNGYENNQSYGSHTTSNKPSYGSSLSSNDRPYGANQGYGGQSSNNNNYDSYGGQSLNKPYGGSQSSNKPYGGSHSEEKFWIWQQSFLRLWKLCQLRRSELFSSGYDTSRPDIKPVYEYEIVRPDDVPSYVAKPNGEIITTRPVAVGDYGGKPGYGRVPGEDVSYAACFRRVLAGRRTLRSHVRRVVNCERLEDCQRECAIERRFHCESFNYRLDPSFRGKGLCELMTKPIEAFDIRRDFVEDKDYDFYEVDRNSLEPNCPDTLRGPGLLHSGFLSNKGPQDVDRWKDRIDWYDRSSQTEYERYYNERRRAFNSNRRYQNQAFVPYQIGDVSRSDEDLEAWRKHGGSYGGYNYYKDKKDYRKSIDHWRISDERHRANYYGVKSHGLNSDFNYDSLGKNNGWDNYGYGYGAWKKSGWNSSWNGSEYVESSHFKGAKPPFYYESEDRADGPPVKDCSSRRRPGMSLGSGAIRRSLFARNVVECEAACFGEKEFKCVSYSYNERPYRGLDMSADSDSDVYAMPQDQGCATISRKPWVESECFWHVRSGAAVGGNVARASLSVTGLGACEAECIRAHAFFCRGFSFRFDSPTIGDDLENCILTSSPPTSLEIGRGLRPTAGHELYARGNYGRGCEPALYDDVQNRERECYLQYDSAAKLKGSAVRGQARVKDEQECGRACTDAPFRCLSFSFNNNARPAVDNCLLSEIRLFDLQRGVDYEHSVDDLLFAFDLFNGRCWRKVHGRPEHEAPSYELPHPLPPLESEYPSSGPSSLDLSGPPESSYPAPSGPSGPDFKPGYPSGPEPPVLKPSYTAPSGPTFKPGYSPGYPPDTAPSGPSGPDFKPGYIPSSPGYIEPSSPSYKPGYPVFDVPSRPYKPIPVSPPKPAYKPPGPSYQDHIPSSPSVSGYKPEYGPTDPVRPYPSLPSKPVYSPGQSRPGYDSDLEENGSLTASWRHYTVSGFPCRRGTACAQNHVAGHWACEPEGGEIGSWDYCCAPTHRCGYSEGFRKPWCYVGPTHEQWRPCSEKYYPYHKHNIPHPSQGQGAKPHRPVGQWRDRLDAPINGERLPGPYLADADRKYWDGLYKNGPQAYYDKNGNPLPGYTRVPTKERPRIKYRHNPPQPGSGTWVAVPELNDFGDIPEPLGSPRYWPVAYLHKGPPPNMTYFRYNETEKTSYDKVQSRDNEDSADLPTESSRNELKKVDVKPKITDIEGRKIKDEPNDNKTENDDNYLKIDTETTTTPLTTTIAISTTSYTTPTAEITMSTNTTDTIKNVTSGNITEVINPDQEKLNEEFESIKGIDGKLEDFSKSLEVFNIEDVSKCDKLGNIKTLEAEERQIEAIGRLVASRRGGKLMIEKRSQKELENKNIAVDKDLLDFNFGNKFPTTERRGFVQRVSKDEIEKERYSNDRSLEVSETTFVRPPRVLSTTENIRKAVVNGKVFYDAMIREQRELFSNSTRKSKSLKLEEARDVITNSVALSSARSLNFALDGKLQSRQLLPIMKTY
ncbi:unnamed protein product, partial [Iphiclides podalirius]